MFVPLPAGVIASQAEWFATTDTRALLEFAVPRIPSRHTCLVLLELLRDISPTALQPGVLGAWCLGEASAEAVLAGRRQLIFAHHLPPSLRRIPGATTAAWAVARALEQLVALTQASDDDARFEAALNAFGWICWARAQRSAELRAAEEAVSWVEEQGSGCTAALSARLEELRDRTGDRICQREGARYADKVRWLIAYPWRKTTEWTVREREIRSGDTLLYRAGARLTGICTVVTPPAPERSRLN